MHRDHAVPLFRRDLFHGLHRPIVAGIVDQNIDRAETILRGRDDARAIGFAGDIACDPGAFASRLLDLARDIAEFRFGARRNQHGSAFGGETPGDGSADSAAAAGYDSNFALEKHEILAVLRVTSKEHSIAARPS